MKSLARAYRTLKKESDGFNLGKDEFVIYIMTLFPMFKTMRLKLPVRPRMRVIECSADGKPKLPEYVEINFEDLLDYLNKRLPKLQAKV